MKRPKSKLKRATNKVVVDAEYRQINGLDEWINSPTLGGVPVTEETALSLTAVYACVSLIASNIASLPLNIYKRLPTGGRQPDFKHRNYKLLSYEPNDQTGANAFWTALIGHAVLFGNGYAFLDRAQDGTVVGLYLLDPRRTQVYVKPDGVIYYETMKTDGTGFLTRHFEENILHIKNLSYNAIQGYSPIQLARESVSGLMAAERAGSAAFGNSATFLGLVTSPDEIDEPARKQLRDNFERVHKGPYNYAKIGFLDQGLQYNPLKISLEDLMYMEFRKWGPNEVARLFGCPPHKIGDLEHATFSNIEESNRDFYQGTLRLWCVRIEDEVNRKLFFDDERDQYFAQYDMNDFLRGNVEAQADMLTKVFALAGLSVNQVCQELGYNPIGEAGEARFISTNLQPFNPSTPETKALDKPDDVTEPVKPKQVDDQAVKQEEPPDPVLKATKSVRNVIASDLSRLLTKEINAVRRASKRPDFPEWRKTFYDDHRAVLTTALTDSLDALSALTGTVLEPSTVAQTFVEQSEAALDQTTDLETLFNTWETGRVTTFMEQYEQS